MSRKLGADTFEIHVVRKMGQVRRFGAEQIDHVQSFFDREVRRVGSEAEGIQNEGVEIQKEFHARGFDAIGVGAISDVSDAKPIDVAIGAVNQGDRLDPRTEDFKGLIVDRDQMKLGCCAGVGGFSFLESIVEHANDSFLHVLGGVHRDRATDHEGKETNVIHAVEVVRVLVGVENAMYDPNSFSKQLLAKIGSGVDEEISPGQTYDGATAGSVIARIRAVANRTAAADSRYPNARPRP